MEGVRMCTNMADWGGMDVILHFVYEYGMLSGMKSIKSKIPYIEIMLVSL